MTRTQEFRLLKEAGENKAVGEKGACMKTLETMLNWIYPAHCPVCHKILQNQSRFVCPECEGIWKPVSEPRCRKCGKPLEREEAELCQDCAAHPHLYEAGAGIFSYDSKKKASLMKYKYEGRRDYSRFYARACCAYGREYIQRWGIQGIIPVPMHRRKERMRGFNQAALIADLIGAELGILVYKDCLRKLCRTESQKKLDAAARRKNLQNAFQGIPGQWEIQRILLVDDVYTTGSTVDAAAAEILRHGVEKVYFLTVFIGKGF